MLSSYFSLNTVAELICLIVSGVCLTKDKSPAWRLMIVLLFFVFIAETGGRYIYFSKLSDSNHWVYNILIVIQAALYHTMFMHIAKRYSISKWPFVTGLGILGISYGYDMVNTGFFVYSMNSLSVLNFLVIVYSFIYYYHLLTDDQLVHLKFFPPFWWVAGIMLFSFGSTTATLFEKKLYGIMLGEHHLAYYIFRVINVLLYSLWSFSFICRKWLYKPEISNTINTPAY